VSLCKLLFLSWLLVSTGLPAFTQVDTGSIVGTVSDSQQLDWLGTSRLRLGYAPIEQFLVYGTAGVAYGHVSESTRATAPGVTISFPGFIPVPPLFPLDNPGSNSGTKVGPAFGGGAEYALSDHLSAKIEYLHYDLGDIVVSGVPMGFSVFHLNTRSDMDGQMVRAGLNYRFDALPGSLMSWMPPQVPTFLESLRTEFGTRYWVSNGKTEKYLYNPTGSHLNSQLTYDNLKAYPTELFARTDHTSGIFLKGNIGIGPLTSGSLKDEDFPPVVSSYSSTVSEQKDGSITYGAVDMGYDFLRKQNYKLGAFVGYSYYHETVNADGCLQIATGSDCISPIPEAVRGITNDGEWQSARVGLNGQIMPTQKLKLTADMAWLPYTSLSSYDTHWLRINSAGGFTGPIPDDGTGHGGYQLESILSCQVTPSLSLGVGGRYWHMETSGESNFEGNTVGGGGKPQPVNFSTDRYGAFVQAAFTF